MSPTHRDRDPLDPKNLIREAFRIDGITAPECRSIFVDWALSLEATDHRPAIEHLLVRYGGEPADHPMHAVLREGLRPGPGAKRRGGRRARIAEP